MLLLRLMVQQPIKRKGKINPTQNKKQQFHTNHLIQLELLILVESILKIIP